MQYYHDLSGKHWNLRRGCLSDPSSVICQYTKSDSHVNMCCNDTNLCNDDSMITTGELLQGSLCVAAAAVYVLRGTNLSCLSAAIYMCCYIGL